MDGPQPPKKVDVPTGGCGCGGEGAFGTWKGAEDHDRALAQTTLGRLVVALRGLVERVARR